jgi:hypothetical protein
MHDYFFLLGTGAIILVVSVLACDVAGDIARGTQGTGLTVPPR